MLCQLWMTGVCMSAHCAQEKVRAQAQMRAHVISPASAAFCSGWAPPPLSLAWLQFATYRRQPLRNCHVHFGIQSLQSMLHQLTA